MAIDDDETVPCSTCGTQTRMTGTKKCDNCFEVEHRIGAYLRRGGDNAQRFMIAALCALNPELTVFAPSTVEHENERFKPRRNFRRTVAIDFDGVICEQLARWSKASEILDNPVAGALDFIEELFDEYDVTVFSARANDPSGARAIREWLRREWMGAGKDMDLIARVPVTSRKVHAHVYIDDKAFRFEGSFPTMDELRELEPWMKRSSSSRER